MSSPSSAPRQCAGQRGFTLVEMITVMVIIGILGAIGTARYFDRAVFDAAAYTEQMRGLIRYGQKVAVAQNRAVYVRLDGNSVALCFNNANPCSTAAQVQAASGSNSASKETVAFCAAATSWACEGKPNGVSYTSTPAVALFYFDALGKPYADADTTYVSTFTRLTVNVASGDGTTSSITVEAESGHVY